MNKYTEGIMYDGACILKDGAKMTISEILSELNKSNKYREALERIARGRFTSNWLAGTYFDIADKTIEEN